MAKGRMNKRKGKAKSTPKESTKMPMKSDDGGTSGSE